MKRSILLIFMLILFIDLTVKGQSAPSSFTVGGDFDKYYPVLFKDANWDLNKSTEIEIGRVYVHENSEWRGSLIMKISYHVTSWGNGVSFINVQLKNNINQFVGGWKDISSSNAERYIIIWLKGGGTTYHYISNNVSLPAPVIYDGTNGQIAYQEINGPLHTYKTVPDTNFNPNGMNYDGDFSINGNLGIGTVAQGAKLAVKGKIIASEIAVTDISNIPDYVFKPDYKLMSLNHIEEFVKQNQHLPDVPSEKEFKEKGMNMVEMNVLLLKKIEELTLYVIEQNKHITDQNTQLQTQNKRISDLDRKIKIMLKNDKKKPL